MTFYKDQGAHVAADGPDCFVGGWGTLSSGGSSPNVPYSVNVDILTDQYCQAKGSSNTLRLKSHFQIHNWWLQWNGNFFLFCLRYSKI